MTSQNLAPGANSKFQIVPFYTLLQRISEHIHSSSVSSHVFDHIFQKDNGLSTAAAWTLIASAFKTPARVAKSLGDAHDELRRWVGQIIYSDLSHNDRRHTKHYPQHNKKKGGAFCSIQFDRDLMDKRSSTYQLTQSTLTVFETAAKETQLCSDRALATLNKFIDSEKDRGSGSRAQVLGFKIQIEHVVDGYLSSLAPLLSSIIFSEFINSNFEYTKQMTRMSKLASHFIRFFLPLCQRTLDVLLGEGQTWLNDIFINKNSSNCTTEKEKRLVMKIRLLDSTLAAFDLFLFPTTYSIHSTGSIKCIALSNRRENVVATASYDGTVIIFGFLKGNGSYDTDDGENTGSQNKADAQGSAHGSANRGKVLAHMRGHTSIVTWCAFSPDDHYLYSCSFDGTLRKWGAATGHSLRVGRDHEDSIMDADLSKDGLRLCTSSMDSTIKLWNAEEMVCTHTFRGHEVGSWIKACCFYSKNDKRVISAGLDKRIVCWDTATSGTGTTGGGGKGGGGEVKRSTNGALRILENAHSDFILALVSHSKQVGAKKHRKHSGAMVAAAAAAAAGAGGAMPDRFAKEEQIDLVASISKDGAVSIWNMEAADGASCVLGTLSMPHGTSCWPCCVTFSNDLNGSLIAVGCINNIVLIYETKQLFSGGVLGVTAKNKHLNICRQLRVMNSGILCLSFTNNNQYLLVGTVDGTIQRLPLV